MIETDKKLIEDLLSEKVTRDEFLQLFSVNLDINNGYILEQLNIAYTTTDSDLLDYVIPVVSFDTNFPNTEKYVQIFCQLLREDWHYRHEDIVSLLEGIKSPNSIEDLFDTASKKFEYLDYDETYSLARKCTYALAAIKSPLAVEKLNLLANHEIEILSGYAKQRLAAISQQST
jgi:hypothetical protein